MRAIPVRSEFAACDVRPEKHVAMNLVERHASWRSTNPRVTIVEASCCDALAVQQLFSGYRVHQVVHLGAFTGVRASFADPALYEQNNVGGTQVLLEAVRRYPVDRFVLVSSSTVYGPNCSYAVATRLRILSAPGSGVARQPLRV